MFIIDRKIVFRIFAFLLFIYISFIKSIKERKINCIFWPDPVSCVLLIFLYHWTFISSHMYSKHRKNTKIFHFNFFVCHITLKKDGMIYIYTLTYLYVNIYKYLHRFIYIKIGKYCEIEMPYWFIWVFWVIYILVSSFCFAVIGIYSYPNVSYHILLHGIFYYAFLSLVKKSMIFYGFFLL